MNEDALRALVRDVISRHLGGELGASYRPLPPRAVTLQITYHPSHGRYAIPSGQDADGPCFIEPNVGCTHCGFCQSHGH
jgi:hypothetical protein